MCYLPDVCFSIGPVDGTAQVSAPDPASGASDKEGHVNGDTKILQDLFAEGIKGAIDHTKVESTNADEDIIMDFEASKIAREAAEELRASRQLCEGHSVSVPTWTGRSGVSGAPKGFLRFGSTQNPKFYINQGEFMQLIDWRGLQHHLQIVQCVVRYASYQLHHPWL